MEVQRILNGSYGTLSWDGEPIYEVVEVMADVEITREDVVTFGGAVDSKMTGSKGSGSFKIDHVYSKGLKKVLEAIKTGKDARFQMSVAINDPDSVGQQRERMNLSNVWFTKFPAVHFTKGEKVQDVYEFGFTVTDLDLAEGIY